MLKEPSYSVKNIHKISLKDKLLSVNYKNYIHYNTKI